jgi:hypothetical protein
MHRIALDMPLDSIFRVRFDGDGIHLRFTRLRHAINSANSNNRATLGLGRAMQPIKPESFLPARASDRFKAVSSRQKLCHCKPSTQVLGVNLIQYNDRGTKQAREKSHSGISLPLLDKVIWDA